METQEKIIYCTICGMDTDMAGTKLCDRCWELKRRIEENPELAKKIISEFLGDK